MRRWIIGSAVLPVCGLAGAQDIPLIAPPPLAPSSSAAAAPSGTVRGRVIAQDTQQPARFVLVLLQLVPTDEGERSQFGGGGGVTVRTDAEGEFTATNIAPGDYFVIAGAAGYVQERALLQAEVAAGADPASLLAAIPLVHVAVSGEATVTVTMERGGTIAGKVVWEDGSPAAGISMSAVLAAAGGAAAVPGTGQLPGALQAIQSPGGSSPFAMTDDRGMFRIAGLATGEYLVRTVIQPPSQQGGGGRGFQGVSSIRVYAPGVFRRAEAKTVAVKMGEERGDVRVVIDLRALRTVSGHVGSATTGQSVASGRVTLNDPNDKDLQVYGSIAANGEFAVRYVPAGSYTLQISGASTQGGGNQGRRAEGGVSFQPFSQAVVVGDGDVSGVGITLTPVVAQP